jgi:hypothetical protein
MPEKIDVGLRGSSSKQVSMVHKVAFHKAIWSEEMLSSLRRTVFDMYHSTESTHIKVHGPYVVTFLN